jgi:outer membrane protein OmpA-like peptidoglycan-associated protein
MARLSTGVVISFDTMAPPPSVTLACAAEPTAVFPGEPVTVTATANNLLPKDHVIYTWSGQGITGTDTTAKVDTTNLAPGSYTVNCGVKEGKPGKEGLKPWESASSTATFTVKEYEPPTISCSANPTDLMPGASSTVTAQGVSPQNRPLTYSYQASGGTISGSGTTATYSSVGASTGPVQITCGVSDDKNHTATANTSVTIEPPPPPPGPSPEQIRLEARLALHSVFFPTALPTAKHPEGGLVDSQQQTLTTLATDFKAYLQFKPDAHLTLTGHADPRGSEKYNQALSERRVDRVKKYLVEQGISDSAITTTAVGKTEELTKDQVKDLVEKNPELSDADKKKVLRRILVIYLAQNRRVDVTLTNTGQQSVQLYPFNAADSATLLSETKPVHGKKAEPKKK